MDTQTAVILEGTKCAWFGNVEQAAERPDGQDPEERVCPFCFGPLVERDRAAFQKRIENFENGTYDWPISNVTPAQDWTPRPHPGFSKLYAWAATQQRCFKHFMHMVNSYKKHTGEPLDVTP
jgi:hypothetical protein